MLQAPGNRLWCDPQSRCSGGRCGSITKVMSTAQAHIRLLTQHGAVTSRGQHQGCTVPGHALVEFLLHAVVEPLSLATPRHLPYYGIIPVEHGRIGWGLMG